MAEKTAEEQAVLDAAIGFVARELEWREELSREGWALLDSVRALPDAKITPLYG